MRSSFRSIEELLRKTNPETPVYCVYPHIYQQSTRHFVDGFPGRVLFAVKSNNHPVVVKLLHKFGIRHFDCASLPEIELVNELCPDSTIYYMNPVRLIGHAHAAQRDHGVRHFVIDHSSGLAPLVDEIDPVGTVIFARMAVSHESAMENLSSKFGAQMVPSWMESPSR